MKGYFPACKQAKLKSCHDRTTHGNIIAKRSCTLFETRGKGPLKNKNTIQYVIFLGGFISWYHLPCICNSLELEPVILHGICYILAWSLCILHGICYIWPCSPSILHGICHILAFQPLICMVFATFWCFKRSCGSLEGSLGFHLGFHLRFHLGFHLGFI